MGISYPGGGLEDSRRRSNRGGIALSRRQFVSSAVAGIAVLCAAPLATAAVSGRRRSLSFYNTHTKERLAATYFKYGRYDRTALREINYLLRDHRSGTVHPIDPGLLDYVHDVMRMTGAAGEIEVVSGYRSPETNHLLRMRSRGVSTKSLHMYGKAIDLRVTDIDTRDLRDAAIELKRGGVGYYAASDFVHMDVGRVRTW